KPIRCANVDHRSSDSSVVRVILEPTSDREVVGEAGDRQDVIDLLTQTRPDVATMDLRMPVLDGITAIRALAEEPGLRHTRYLVLTTFDHDELVTEAIRAATSGYLLKDAAPDHLR